VAGTDRARLGAAACALRSRPRRLRRLSFLKQAGAEDAASVAFIFSASDREFSAAFPLFAAWLLEGGAEPAAAAAARPAADAAEGAPPPPPPQPPPPPSTLQPDG